MARYSYDAFGKCTILKDVDGIATKNPIRWKSLYYDVESGLYYIDGRYYSPETRQFLSPVPAETILGRAATVFGLNPYLITLDNTVNRVYNGYKAQTVINSTVSSFRDKNLPDIPWLVNNSTTIYGAISSLSAGIPILIHYYKYASIINDELKLYGISKWKTSLQLSNVSFKLGALDGALIGVNVLIDMYDSYQRGVSTEGILLGGALTAASGVGMLYLNKGVMWATTIIGTAICPGIGTAIGFTVGLIGSILVDIFLGGWITNWIDDNIK